jgi:hypothetical protein
MSEKLTLKRVSGLIAAAVPVEIRDAQAPGLTIRIRQSGEWRWSIRRSVASKDYRLDLGNAWTLEKARNLALDVDRRIKCGLDPWVQGPSDWHRYYEPIRRKKLGIPDSVIVVRSFPQPATPAGPLLKWTAAVDMWIDEVLRTRRKKTAESYKKSLHLPEIRIFEDELQRDNHRDARGCRCSAR